MMGISLCTWCLWVWFFFQYFGLLLEQLGHHLGLFLEQLGQQHLSYFLEQQDSSILTAFRTTVSI
jgi:hypothetical protein